MIGLGLNNVFNNLVSFQRSTLAMHVSKYPFLRIARQLQTMLVLFPHPYPEWGKCFQKLIILGLNSIPIARVRGKISCPQISYPEEDMIW